MFFGSKWNTLIGTLPDSQNVVRGKNLAQKKMGKSLTYVIVKKEKGKQKGKQKGKRGKEVRRGEKIGTRGISKSNYRYVWGKKHNYRAEYIPQSEFKAVKKCRTPKLLRYHRDNVD